MCIAILNNTEKLNFETIKNCFKNNPDGASFTYIDTDIIKTYKEMQLNNLKTFYIKYAEIREINKFPIMLHFRIGTSGIKDNRNLHPFFINKNLAMVHNGIFTITSIYPEYSDTYHFAKLCRQFKSHDVFLNTESFEFRTIQDLIGNSKIIYLDNKGKYSIMNEAFGHWDKNNNWYSNKTYETCNYYDFGGTKTYKYPIYNYNELNSLSNDKTMKTNYFNSKDKCNYCQYNDNFHVKKFGWFMDLNYEQKCKQIRHLIKSEKDISNNLFHYDIVKLHEYYGTNNLYDLYIMVWYDCELIDQTTEERNIYESEI